MLGGHDYILDLKAQRIRSIQSELGELAEQAKRFNSNAALRSKEVLDSYHAIVEDEKTVGLLSKGIVGKADNPGSGDMYRTLTVELSRWEKLLPKEVVIPNCKTELIKPDELIEKLFPAEVNLRAEQGVKCLSNSLAPNEAIDRAIESHNEKVEVITSYGGKIAKMRRIPLLEKPEIRIDKISKFQFNAADIIYTDLFKNRLLAHEPVAVFMAFLAILLDIGTIAAMASATRVEVMSKRRQKELKLIRMGEKIEQRLTE